MPMPAANQALHLFQWGPELTAPATVVLTLDTIPTNAVDTMLLGSTTYTFRNAATVQGDILIGTLPATKTAIIAALNGTDGLNPPNGAVKAAAAWNVNDLTITARSRGTGGNSIPSTETFTAVTNVFATTTLLSGTGARGTLVPATSKMIVEDIDFEPLDKNIRPDLAKGLLMANRGNEQAISRGTKWIAKDQPLSFEQLQNWLSMLTGNFVVTPGAPNVWVFTWSPLLPPDPITWTMERRLSDGTAYVDQRFGYAMMQKIGFKHGQNKEVSFNATGFARRIQAGPITSSLTMPAPHIPSSAEVSVYIDSSWANLGNTLVSDQVYGGDLDIDTGFIPIVTSPGRSDLDFGTYGVNAKNVQATYKPTMLLAPGLQYNTEKTAAEAATLRAVRVQIDDTASRQIQIDMLMKHEAASMFKIGEFQGSDVVAMNLVGSTDDTNFWRITLKNSVATLV